MKKILFIVVLSATFINEPATAAPEIVVLQSIRVKPYEEALKGFTSVCRCRIKRLEVSGLKGADVARQINKIRPRMVLAIGAQALAKAKEIQNMPVVYIMVLNPQSISAGKKNITGVGMTIPAEKQLTALLDTLPGAANIGLVYDPEKTGGLVQSARAAAAKFGVNLITGKIHQAKEAPSSIRAMKGKIDVFWMLPDLTVVTPETVEFLLLFSFENKIPLFTFSEKYVEMGAFMSMDIDAVDIGRQAGAMALEIFAGREVKDVEPVYARKAVISTNLMIAKKIGINLALAMNSAVEVDEKIFRRTQTIKPYPN